MDCRRAVFSKRSAAIRTVAPLLCIVILFVVLPGCGGGGTQTGDLRVGVLSGDMRQLPYYVASEKGFFRDAGLEVKDEMMFGTGAELMSAFEAGQIDMGYVDLGSPVTFAGRNMADVKVLAQSSEGGSALIVKSGLEAADIKELKDQRVGIPGTASLEDYLLRTALEKAGVAENEITTIEVRPYEMVSYLSAGSIEAFIGFEPYPAEAQEDEAGRIIMTSEDIVKNMPSSLLVLDSSFADKNPETVKKIQKAHRNAIEFIQENPVESIDLGNLEINTGKEASVSAMESINYSSAIDRRSLEDYVGFLVDLGIIDVEPADFVEGFVIDGK